MKESIALISLTDTNSSFKIGDEVEVRREQLGYTGAWYEATIVGSAAESSNNKRKQWGFWVEYKHLLDNQPDKKGNSKPLREYVRKRALLRPKPPCSNSAKELKGICFKKNDMVDAYHLAGWWAGVVGGVLKEGCSYTVEFKNPDEELEVSHLNLRFHFDWVDGIWIRPSSPEKHIDLQLENSSAAKKHSIKETASSKKKLGSSESCGDVVHTVKKLKIRRSVVDCNKVEDRELKEENNGSVADESTLSAEKPIAHFLKCTGDKGRKRSDPAVSIIEHRSPGSSTKEVVVTTCEDVGEAVDIELNDKDVGSVEKQVIESTLQDPVDEQCVTNQAEVAATDGINTSAGASAAAVQPSVRTSTQQPKGSPEGELNSITTPDQILSPPFKKNSTVWKIVESMEVFTKYPQNPHFLPLAQYEEKKREEVAVQKMIKYAFVVEKISNLTTAELNSSTDINDILESLKDLEKNGFEVNPIRLRLDALLMNIEKLTHLQNKLKEVEYKLGNMNCEKAEVDNEIREIDTKVKDLEKLLVSAKNVKETIDRDIMVLKSKKGAIREDLRRLQFDFEEKRIFG